MIIKKKTVSAIEKVYFVFITISLFLTSCTLDKGTDPDTDPDMSEFKVLEYLPAPGQFVNEQMNCKTMEEANAYAEARFADDLYISLGAFGGYIIVKLPAENKNGYDFGIIGNPFEGSSEPGIVWVSEDSNQNGIADDAWYELQGSDTSTRNYEVTYTRPSQAGDIPWKDNCGNEGVINYLPEFHRQMYYPEWVREETYTLTGSKLASRSVEENGIWKNKSFDRGYADNTGSDVANQSNGTYLYNQFDISDAVDSKGNPVALQKIHFIKVQSAILQNAGILGEVSTEIAGFRIL